MRVLHYVDAFKLAWMEPWFGLLKELEKLGVENVVLCRGGGVLESELKGHGFRGFFYTPPAQWLPALAFGVGRVIRTVRPDLIHTRLSAAAMLGGWWGRHLKVPVLSTFDKYPKARYYRNSDVLIGCSSAVTEYVKSLSLPRAKAMETILNPIEPERYLHDDAVRADFRREMGVRDDEVVVLGMGRFVGWKAWDDYLRAIALLSDLGHFRFWLVGGGDEGRRDQEGALRELAKELGIAERVEFFPFADDVRPWLWGADVFVQPSKEPEGFSLMLAEAMAAGLPPVTTAIGGALDIVRDGVSGLLVPPQSPVDLASALRRMADAEFRVKLAHGARRSAAEVSAGRVAAQTFELYERVLSTMKKGS